MQREGSDFWAGTATFGLWQDPSDTDPVVETAVQSAGITSFDFVSDSSGNPPEAGQFTYVNFGAGSVAGATMFILTRTENASGGAGSPVVLTPCDATDQSQWWVVESAR